MRVCVCVCISLLYGHILMRRKSLLVLNEIWPFGRPTVVAGSNPLFSSYNLQIYYICGVKIFFFSFTFLVFCSVLVVFS